MTGGLHNVLLTWVNFFSLKGDKQCASELTYYAVQVVIDFYMPDIVFGLAKIS